MKKAIFLGLLCGSVFLVIGFWLGFKANTPEIEVSVSIEEMSQAQSETPTKGVLPKSVQKSPIFAQTLTQEKEETEEPKTEVVKSEVSEVGKRLAELGFSAKKFHKISTK